MIGYIYRGTPNHFRDYGYIFVKEERYKNVLTIFTKDNIEHIMKDIYYNNFKQITDIFREE